MNCAVRKYNDVITQALDDLAPARKVTLSDKPKAPWWNEELLMERQETRRLERKWQTSRLEIDKQIYHDARKTYFTNIDAAKTNYHRAKISEASAQQLFSLIDNLIGS